MADTLLIMNFKNENIGYIKRCGGKFVQHYNGVMTESEKLPRILADIAPAPTQFPAANDVLDYYGLKKPDVWAYLARSNGFKSSRDVWFMAEPTAGTEVWIPLVLGMQRYQRYDALLREGDAVRVLMNGKAYINRHTINILPECVQPYLVRNDDTRFSTVTGYVKCLHEYPSTKGLIGRVVLAF